MSDQALGTRAPADMAAGLRPHHPIPGITYRSAEYAHDQLQRGNWLDMAIGESLRRTAKEQPDKVAVIDPDGPVTFRELDAHTELVAASLLNWGSNRRPRAIPESARPRNFSRPFSAA